MQIKSFMDLFISLYSCLPYIWPVMVKEPDHTVAFDTVLSNLVESHSDRLTSKTGIASQNNRWKSHMSAHLSMLDKFGENYINGYMLW